MSLMKGSIGVAKRIHYLDQVDRPQFGVWASSACGSWAGAVKIVPEKVPVSCGACRKLDPSKIETKDISHRPFEPGKGVF